jgi:DNA processing protein
MDNTTFTARILALWRLLGIGPASFAHLQQVDPTFERFFHQQRFSPLLTQILPKLLPGLNPDWAGVERDLTWLQAKPHHHLVYHTAPEYPELLLAIPRFPPLLFVSGSLEALSFPHQIAVVGSRHPSKTGTAIAFEWAQELSQAGVVVTSGLALGIDAHAHEGAIAAKAAPTIGVLGSGINVIYPAQHVALAERILAHQGALVSEFPTGTTPQPNHFPRRNRIISGLSRGVLVVEAALKSGSLITAQFALDQGREVFAVPGNVLGAQSQGCHTLIQQGAKLCMSVHDILEEFDWHSRPGGVSSNVSSANLSPGTQGAIWRAVSDAIAVLPDSFIC